MKAMRLSAAQKHVTGYAVDLPSVNAMLLVVQPEGLQPMRVHSVRGPIRGHHRTIAGDEVLLPGVR